jgi:hypothetical protein
VLRSVACKKAQVDGPNSKPAENMVRKSSSKIPSPSSHTTTHLGEIVHIPLNLLLLYLFPESLDILGLLL